MLEVIIVDDRPAVGKRVANRFHRYLQQNGIPWNVNYLPPFKNRNEYNRYIIDNKVVLLVIDEKLDVPISGIAVDYNGHDVVEYLRKFNKELPIFIITAYPETDDLLLVEGQADGIISRSKFVRVEDSNQIIMRLVRSTHRYLENYSKEYERLAILSNRVVTNKASTDERRELVALRVKLDVENSIVDLDRKDWLTSLSDEVKELKTLISLANKIINKP